VSDDGELAEIDITSGPHHLLDGRVRGGDEHRRDSKRLPSSVLEAEVHVGLLGPKSERHRTALSRGIHVGDQREPGRLPVKVERLVKDDQRKAVSVLQPLEHRCDCESGRVHGLDDVDDPLRVISFELGQMRAEAEWFADLRVRPRGLSLGGGHLDSTPASISFIIADV